MKMKSPEYLQSMSVEELEAMKQALEYRLQEQLLSRKKEALKSITEIVKGNGLSYEEVVAAIRTTTKRGKAVGLYRNPDNIRQTWSGKGEPPHWYVSCPDPESLRIPTN